MSRFGVFSWGILAVVLMSLGPSVYAAQDSGSKTKRTEELVVDINRAPVKELARLPGIGDKVAARIVAYREENGPFKKIEDIMNVRGIGEKTFVKLRDHLVVNSGSKKRSSKKS